MAIYETLSDKQLIESAQKGDTKAQATIIHKYKNLVKIKSRTYFIMGADKEDIIQEGMIGLFKATRDYDPAREVTFYTFAELCITRQIITAIKSANRQKHLPLNSYLSLDKSVYEEEEHRTFLDDLTESISSNPEDLFINKEDKITTEEIIVKILSRLESEVLKLYLDGNSYVEIALLISKDEKSIDNALQRIRKKVVRIVGDKRLDQTENIC